MENELSDMAQRLVTGARNVLNTGGKLPRGGANSETRPSMSHEEAMARIRETTLFMISFYGISTSTMAMMTMANFTVPMFLFLTFAAVWWALVVISSTDTYWLIGVVSSRERDLRSDRGVSVDSKCKDGSDCDDVNRTDQDRLLTVVRGMVVFKELTSCVYALGVCGAILSIFIPGAVWKATACMCSTMLLVPGIVAVAWGFTAS